ncbi:hypothetical protein [Sphingopyxis solisilvae]|uniref:hypothetical protein n=1 Tax=Sphingopyxis solisilvae TaxID=1886788 RepID=UPI0040353A1E
MEFRSPTVAAQQNSKAMRYLTKGLSDAATGRSVVESLIAELGNAVDQYPDWHPLLTLPPRNGSEHISDIGQLKSYEGVDHTQEFVSGFVTCPYSETRADKLVAAVNEIRGLYARRLASPLYADNTHPVVVAAMGVELEGDGTIKSRDSIAWFTQNAAAAADSAQVAETWWNIRSNILGRPHGSRSSLFVNQHSGTHMRKILEAMNESGIFGPILEMSLDMLSAKKRDTIARTLICTAVDTWDGERPSFEFNLRDEVCKAAIRDTWEDGMELSVRIEIGKHDLYVTGFYYPKDKKITHTDPTGRRKIAEKFL